MALGSRLHNAKRNLMASYVSILVQLVFQFLSRSVIVYTLGKEYLGITGLFTSILQVLNMAEMGFSAAIVYNMYKPLAAGDNVMVCALLAYYKKIYKYIGCVILVVGVVLAPFLPNIIKGEPPHELNLFFIYFLYLLNTSASYFLFAHKTALLNALQRMDLTKISTIIINVIQYSFQIISLLYFHNFYVFLVISILGTISINILNGYISKQKFPYLEAVGEIGTDMKSDIKRRVKGLLIGNISGLTYTTLDSIILSAFIGLTSVAIYNNYLAVFGAVATVVTVIRTSVQASVGNSVASETINKNYNDMVLLQYLFSFIGTWCMTVLICLYQPFMEIWMGEDMLLPMLDVVMLGVWFLVSVVQHAHYLYLSANGLWVELQWPYVCGMLFNLLLNISLGKIWGTTGIILSSLLSVFIFSNIWQCLIIFTEYFHFSAKDYYVHQFIYFVVAVLVTVTSYMMCGIVQYSGIVGFSLKVIICGLVPVVMLICIYRRFSLYNRAQNLVFAVIKTTRLYRQS